MKVITDRSAMFWQVNKFKMTNFADFIVPDIIVAVVIFTQDWVVWDGSRQIKRCTVTVKVNTNITTNNRSNESQMNLLCGGSISHIVTAHVLKYHFTMVVWVCTGMLICPGINKAQVNTDSCGNILRVMYASKRCPLQTGICLRGVCWSLR